MLTIRSELLEKICLIGELAAFVNSTGGVLLLGVKDRNHKCKWKAR